MRIIFVRANRFCRSGKRLRNSGCKSVCISRSAKYKQDVNVPHHSSSEYYPSVAEFILPLICQQLLRCKIINLLYVLSGKRHHLNITIQTRSHFSERCQLPSIVHCNV